MFFPSLSRVFLQTFSIWFSSIFFLVTEIIDSTNKVDNAWLDLMLNLKPEAERPTLLMTAIKGRPRRKLISQKTDIAKLNLEK